MKRRVLGWVAVATTIACAIAIACADAGRSGAGDGFGGATGGSVSSSSGAPSPTASPEAGGPTEPPLIACRYERPSDGGVDADAGVGPDAGTDASDPCSGQRDLECETSTSALEYELGACTQGGVCTIVGVSRRSCSGGCFRQGDGGVGCNP